jgi:hypothetical protein
MENYIKMLEAVKIINRNFNCNIDARGDSRLYYDILKTLKLRDFLFTEKKLLNAIYNYKKKELYEMVYENR